MALQFGGGSPAHDDGSDVTSNSSNTDNTGMHHSVPSVEMPDVPSVSTDTMNSVIDDDKKNGKKSKKPKASRHLFGKKQKKQKKNKNDAVSDTVSTVSAAEHNSAAAVEQTVDDPKWPIVVTVCAFIAALALIVPIMMAVSNHSYFNAASGQAASLRAQTKKINEQIAALDETPTMTKEQVISAKNSAVGAGDQVAKLQNKYKETLSASTVDPDKANNDATNIGVELDKYMAGDSKNARTPWYTDAGTWRFVSSFAFSGSSMPVLWVCEETNTATNTADAANNQTAQPTILAWARGVYDAADNTFSRMVTGVSVAGNSKKQSTTSSGTSSNTAIDKAALDKAIAALREDEDAKKETFNENDKDKKTAENMSPEEAAKAREDIAKARQQAQQQASGTAQGDGAIEKSEADQRTEQQFAPQPQS